MAMSASSGISGTPLLVGRSCVQKPVKVGLRGSGPRATAWEAVFQLSTIGPVHFLMMACPSQNAMPPALL
jgi:hypothetical protein